MLMKSKVKSLEELKKNQLTKTELKSLKGGIVILDTEMV